MTTIIAEPKSALLMKPEWAHEILHNGKDLELRSSPCHSKVGKTVALGTGGMLLGEVTIVGCFLLAHVRDGHLEDHKPYSFRSCAITSMIGLWLSTKIFGLGNWKIRLSTALQNHIFILRVQLFGLIWPNNVMENHLSSGSRNNASDEWWLRRDLQLPGEKKENPNKSEH